MVKYSLYPQKPKPENKRRLLYSGWDPARQCDGSGYCVLEQLEDGSLETRLLMNFKGLTYLQQVEEIIRIHTKYGLTKLAVDGTNNLTLVESLQKEFRQKIIAVTFTRATKEELVADTRIMMQDKKLRINQTLPLYRLLVKEAHDLDVKTLDHPLRGSSDLFWSLALAIHASKRGLKRGKASSFTLFDR